MHTQRKNAKMIQIFMVVFIAMLTCGTGKPSALLTTANESHISGGRRMMTYPPRNLACVLTNQGNHEANRLKRSSLISLSSCCSLVLILCNCYSIHFNCFIHFTYIYSLRTFKFFLILLNTVFLRFQGKVHFTASVHFTRVCSYNKRIIS